MAETIKSAINTVADVALSTMRPGEEPTTLKAGGMELQLARERLQDLLNKTIELENGFSAECPSILSQDDNGGGEEAPSLDSKVSYHLID